MAYDRTSTHIKIKNLLFMIDHSFCISFPCRFWSIPKLCCLCFFSTNWLQNGEKCEKSKQSLHKQTVYKLVILNQGHITKSLFMNNIFLNKYNCWFTPILCFSDWSFFSGTTEKKDQFTLTCVFSLIYEGNHIKCSSI